MRTRLDEIVEEELASFRDDLLARTAEGERIAERAFRHGCEQTAKAYWAATGVTNDPAPLAKSVSVYGVPVQPAPAEEKMIFAPPQYYAGCGWNRRLGERRKGREICPHAPEYSGRCFVFIRPDGTVYHAGDSRHKDRRKP